MTTPGPSLFGRYRPGAPVLVGSTSCLDVATVRRRVAQVSSALPSPPGEVLVSCRDRASFVVTVLAAWQRGLSVALPPNLGRRTLAELQGQPGIVTHVHDDDPCLAFAANDEPWLGADDRVPGLAPEQHLASIYTSGSTGSPKVVRKAAHQLLEEADVLVATFGLDARDRVLATVPPHHIYGLLFGILVPLACGGLITARSALHASAVEAAVREHRATVIVSTPAHLRGLEMLDRGGLPTVHRVFSSGAPLEPATAAMVRDRLGCSVTEVLGSTETGGIAWRDADGGRDVPWRPLPGVRTRAGDDGRLLLRSPFLPASASQPFAADDRIEPLEDGTFRHIGRIDDVVKVGGKRISVADLEAKLRSLPGVRDVAVVADAAPDGRGQRVRAAVVAPGSDPTRLRSALLQWFDPVVVPRRIVLLDALPREATGKLRRATLVRWLDGGVASTGVGDLLLRPLPADDTRELSFEVEVPRDLVYFEGHFPDNPVLPGVVELEALAVRPAMRRWPDLGGLRRVQRLKFKQPIAPGDRLRLRLHRTGHRVTFELRRGDETCATALLVFGAVSGG